MSKEQVVTFQAGVFYFDGRPIADSEASAILTHAGTSNSGAPACHRQPGILLAQAPSPLDNRAAGQFQSYVGPAGAISFDGRLDNRDELLDRLRGVVPGDPSPAMLALAAYEKWGPDGFIHLIGDWSLVIWDGARNCIVLASDFAGVRPLYYCAEKYRVLWSSRLGPLVDWAQAGEIDDQYVAGLLMFSGCPNRTPFRGVCSVPPGSSVRLGGNGIQMERFWKPPVAETIRYQQETEYDEHLLALFREAVRRRLPANGRALCELSGGLDSSSIVCMASRLIRSGEAQSPPIATLTYEHEGSIDQPFYTAVEKHCGAEAIHVSTDAYPFLTETNTGGAAPAFWETLNTHVAAIAREAGATTYCTGRTGDLLMGNLWDDSDQVAGLLRKGMIVAALKESLAWSKALRIPIYWVLWRAFLTALPPWVAPATTDLRTRSSNPSLNKEDSIAPAFRQRTGISNARSFFSQAWTHARPERRRLFRGVMETLELRRLQPPEPLQHLDYTHPYAHRPLVEFMLTIPADVVCRPAEPRRLMRLAFRELWPPELRKRRSKDVFTGVFLESLRPLAGEMLKQPRRLQVVERGYVDPESLKERLELISHSLECNEPQLRQIILLEFWLRGRESRLKSQSVSLSA